MALYAATLEGFHGSRAIGPTGSQSEVLTFNIRGLCAKTS